MDKIPLKKRYAYVSPSKESSLDGSQSVCSPFEISRCSDTISLSLDNLSTTIDTTLSIGPLNTSIDVNFPIDKQFNDLSPDRDSKADVNISVNNVSDIQCDISGMLNCSYISDTQKSLDLSYSTVPSLTPVKSESEEKSNNAGNISLKEDQNLDHTPCTTRTKTLEAFSNEIPIDISKIESFNEISNSVTSNDQMQTKSIQMNHENSEPLSKESSRHENILITKNFDVSFSSSDTPPKATASPMEIRPEKSSENRKRKREDSNISRRRKKRIEESHLESDVESDDSYDSYESEKKESLSATFKNITKSADIYFVPRQTRNQRKQERYLLSLSESESDLPVYNRKKKQDSLHSSQDEFNLSHPTENVIEKDKDSSSKLESKTEETRSKPLKAKNKQDAQEESRDAKEEMVNTQDRSRKRIDKHSSNLKENIPSKTTSHVVNGTKNLKANEHTDELDKKKTRNPRQEKKSQESRKRPSRSSRLKKHENDDSESSDDDSPHISQSRLFRQIQDNPWALQFTKRTRSRY